MKKSNVTIRLDAETIALLDDVAKYHDRDRSYVIKLAIDEYLHYQKWRLEEINKAIAEADAGDFATDEEVAATFAKFRADPAP
jgi:predicted transcriptional regulator